MENFVVPTQICTICQEAKPYPGHFVANYNTMELRSFCRDCKYKKMKAQKLIREGKTEKASSWKHSMNQFYKH